MAPSYRPTAAEAKKYADYSVEFRESVNPVSIGDMDGRPFRVIMTVHRVPSTKTFIVFIRKNVTARERAKVLNWGARYPKGAWADFPDCWFRGVGKTSKVVYYRQAAGVLVNDPLIELEMSIVLDTDLDSEMQSLVSAGVS